MSVSRPHLRFVLCEGSHDLNVMQKVLEHQYGYKKSRRTLDELPQPLGSFVRKWIERHFLRVKVDRVGHPEQPNFSLVMSHPTEEVHLAFFTAGGGLDNETCRVWLKSAQDSLGSPIGLPPGQGSSPWTESTSWAAVVDADADADGAVAGVNNWYGDKVFKPGVWTSQGGGPQTHGLWVWPNGDATEPGTLEPVLDAIDGGPAGTPGSAIVALLDAHAPAGSKYTRQNIVSAHNAARIKARLTVHAQWTHPGASWANWLRDEGLSAEFIADSTTLTAFGAWLVEGLP